MKIKDISLGWISTADISRAKKFFHEDLGLEISSDNEDMGWLELQPKGQQAMTLGIAQDQGQSPHKPGANAVLTFIVENIQEAKQELLDKGVTLEGDIHEVPGHVKLLSFFDKDHNRFQLVEVIG